MILTDREIEIALGCGQIGVDPHPGPEAFSSTSLDLTLSRSFSIWHAEPGVQIRPGAKGYSYTNLLKHQEREEKDEFVLHSGKFVLGWTEERIDLPINSRLAGRVEGKSSLARLGIGVHVTAPTIHAGFEGQIQLEMFNFGPRDVVLDAGMKICQLIFEQTFGTPNKGYAGLFTGQSSKAS